jgi:hypothetical protein
MATLFSAETCRRPAKYLYAGDAGSRPSVAERTLSVVIGAASRQDSKRRQSRLSPPKSARASGRPLGMSKNRSTASTPSNDVRRGGPAPSMGW